MNSTPFRESGSTDQTEVQCTKIREAEATKRHRIEQTEETRRIRIKTLRDAPWFMAGAITLIVAVAGGVSYSNWLDARYPKPAQCFETEEIISVEIGSRPCSAGGWYEEKSVEGKPGLVLVHCHCGPQPEEMEQLPME
jgi:hypothetical protein